jgi:hypothetical protein
MAVGLVDLLEAGQCYPVYSSLLSRLDSLSIVRLSKTCRRLVDLYRDAIPREWNVDRLLLPFVKQPVALRNVMRDHNVVVSGDLALQFFERSRQTDRMDLFVVGEDGATALGQYLESREGYKASEEPTSEEFGRVSEPSVDFSRQRFHPSG